MISFVLGNTPKIPSLLGFSDQEKQSKLSFLEEGCGKLSLHGH